MLFVSLATPSLWASFSPPGDQVLTGSLPPFPACELESTLEIVKCDLPRSLEDLRRGHPSGWGP